MWISGSLAIAPNDGAASIVSHAHTYPHTTWARRGWVLIRARLPEGDEIVQIASEEFAATRALLLKYEPQSLLVPMRYDDLVDPDTGALSFVVRLVVPGEDAPPGGVEIPFEPQGYHYLTRANTFHELVALAPNSAWDCVYSHREGDGEVVDHFTGNMAAYS